VNALEIVERPSIEHFPGGTNDGGQAGATKRGPDRYPAHPEFTEFGEGEAGRPDAGDVVERLGTAAACQANRCFVG